MGTMAIGNFNNYVREYFDGMQSYTNNHKMMVLKRFAVNIKQLYTSEAIISFLTHMQDVEYVENEWPKLSNNKTWIKRHFILMHTDLIASIADYARIFLNQFTMVDLYKYYPEGSTIYWQKIGGKPYSYGYKTTFQFYSAVGYNSDYPFTITTSAISDGIALEMDGYFIIMRGDDPTTDLWRLAELMYGDKEALKYKQM